MKPDNDGPYEPAAAGTLDSAADPPADLGEANGLSGHADPGNEPDDPNRHEPSEKASDPVAFDQLPLTVVESTSGWRLVNVRELWAYRELLYFLVWRDVKVRYKETVLGAAWAILQPFATMVVFSFVLGRVAGVHRGGVPYPLFAFAGILPWVFFANAIGASSNSIVGNQNLITKVYFPRLIIPMGAVGAGVFDFAIAFAMLLVLLVYYAVVPGWSFLLVPVLAAALALTALGVGTLLSALTVAYRDFRHIVPFMVQLWMFATPSIYMDTTSLGAWSNTLLPLNPMHGLIQGFRSAVLGLDFDPYSLAVSGSVSLALLLFGCFYFRRVERSFADII